MGIIQVRRANVILDVPDYQQNEYLAKGFDVIGADGKIVAKAIPNDPNSLRKAYAELTAENQALKKEIEALKETIASKTEVKAPKPIKVKEPVKAPEPEEVEESDDLDEIEEEDFVPINRRKSKKSK